MPELTAPSVALYSTWLEAHREWGRGPHEDGFGLLPEDNVDSTAGFSAWVERLNGEAHVPTENGKTYQCIYRWIVDGSAVVGGIALRQGDHPLILTAGHVGYGIRPSARRRGLATWALRTMLDEAQQRGMDRVLLVCDAANTASVATIERNGGTLEHDERSPVRRYWIDL